MIPMPVCVRTTFLLGGAQPVGAWGSLLTALPALISDVILLVRDHK